METAIKPTGKLNLEELYASYGDLALRLLPSAVRISIYDASGEIKWSKGEEGIADRGTARIIEPIIPGGSNSPHTERISDALTAVAVPVVIDRKVVNVLVAYVLSINNQSERRLTRDVVSATAPWVDCLCREIGQIGHQPLASATLSERTEELEWLFSLTESLHTNSNNPKAINQLLGAAVERIKCNFGAVVVPDHGLELTYASMLRIDIQAAGVFERSRPHFLNYVQRRREALVANKVSATENMPAFKLLVVPIEPHKDVIIGFISFLRAVSEPNFNRRQLFLARHLGHQIGSLLESQYDLATGLFTRNPFEKDVRRLLSAVTEDSAHSLMYFDIDSLHVINDTLGFDAGDQAIVRVAELFRPPMLPENALASRIGGDSFLIYLPDHDAEQAGQCAQRILNAAKERTVGEGHAVAALLLSCGIVRLYSTTGALDNSIATAQLACKSAKAHGGNRYEVYLEVDDSMMRRRHDILEVAQIRAALAGNRFRIYGQKIVSSSDINETRGIECLLRMLDDDGKIVGPSQFMPSAQRYQMLQPIDSWVISTTLSELKDYRSLLRESKITVSINISGQSIQDEVFIESIEKWILESMIAPGLIRFEITETVAISNLARAERLIRKLRQHGCSFALDDFGVGVNSLSYLKVLPVSCVKIDGSFTKDLMSNNRSDVMVNTIVRLAGSLGIECVAEHVETPRVLNRLRELGVVCVQGYIAHQAEPLRELLDTLKGDESQRLRQLFDAQ
jgi:diguanylate cyclase (GGDEF)-like protein